MDRCRLPWSRHLPSGCLECRCNIKHQLMLETSYLVMETHANSTLSKCMLLACAYQSAKENGHCQIKILPRLWTTIWQRKAVWKTLFQNKSGGTINPVYLPQTTPEQNKEGVNKNTLSISNLAQYFILQLMRNVPWTTMTSIELRLLNTCCITQKVRCWGGNNQKDTAKEQGHGRKTYKVFSLNPFLLIWGR